MAEAEVDVWWLPEANGATSRANAIDTLDESELARAGRFRFERDRARFIRRRAFVRRVLARYLSVEPRDVMIQFSPFGRPQVDSSIRLSFNVSHADDLSVLAVTRMSTVGIDIERLRPMGDELGIAATVFAKPEFGLLSAVAPETRSLVFLELWTRKESLVKASGRGLHLRLDSFSVVAEDGGWVKRPRGASGSLPYTVAPLDTPAGYIGAIAAAAARIEVHDRGSEPGAF